uniref:Ribonuclease H-like domain-containing protein n=1 Tax=Tanacetum cinerariifolium TaxID=118510 RepID=A0A6L2MY25_TANCI|nr:ribonuclease H-like domain-containing protein [Tanacetum cinerariifolium]
MLDSQVNDKSKIGVGYHEVLPPYTRNFMPSKPDLILADMDEYFVSKSVTSLPAVATNKAKTSEPKPKSVSEPLIEDWVKSPMESVKQEKHNRQAKNPRKTVKVLEGNPQLELQEKGVIDSGCSRHMTENMSYSYEYEEIDGGYVAFGGDLKGIKITGKGKTSTDSECVVLSFDFKLLDESQVLLRVSRKNNMYNVELKNVALSGDHLGKFDQKADEGFFVRYSVNNKAFRVFNSRTRILEETLHITFLENKPNVARSGPTWLFNIDTLTKSMNYKPIVARNQSNGSASKGKVETVPEKDYILLPLWTLDPLFFSSSKDSPGDGFKLSGEEEKKDTKGSGNEESEAPITEEPRVNHEKDNVNSTNRVNAVSSTINAASNEVNVVGRKSSIKLPDDPNMPDLEDTSIFKDSNKDVFDA